MVEINLGLFGHKSHGSKARGHKQGLLKVLAEINIGVATGAAVMLFLVAVASSATLIIHRELSSAVSASVLGKAQAKSKVLGLASYGYQQPSCANNVCLRYELFPVSNNNFAADIFYFSQSTKPIRGSIRVNKQRFVNNIRGAGITSTGYSLKPGDTYSFVFYSGLRGSGRVLNTLDLTMPSNESPIICSPRLVPPEGCYYDNSHPCGGNLVCDSKPTYGYQAVDVGPIAPGSWREGWIDQASYGSTVEPGSIKLMGWAYDGGNSLTYNRLSIVLKNSSTGDIYQPTNIDIEHSARADLQSYLARKRDGGASFASNIYSFIVKFENLPAGSYIVYNAKYNGHLFNVHGQSAYPIVINSKDKPTYGYGGALQIIPEQGKTQVKAGDNQASLFGFRISNAGGNGAFALTSISFVPSSEVALKSIGADYYITDEYGTVVGKYDPYNKPTTQYGYNVLFSPPLTIGVNQVRYLNFKSNINTYGSGSFKFMPWDVGYQSPLPSGYGTPGRVDGLRSSWSGDISIFSGVPVKSSITVSSPNGGETWGIGKYYNIQWAPGNIEIISVQLMKSGTPVYRWDPPYYFSSINWQIQASSGFGALVSGSDYKIRVNYRTGEGTTAFDESDAPFSIVSLTSEKTSMSLSSPNGGETFVKGETYKISWAAQGTSNFYLKLRKGSVGDTVVGIPTNNMVASQKIGDYIVYYSMDWTVPSDLADGSDYAVRVLSSDISGLLDDSDNYFTIVAKKPTASVLKITGVQGYNPDTGAYTNSIASGKYMILYGSFSTNTDNYVIVAKENQQVVYQSLNQINVKLGNLTGYSASVQVENKIGGSSNIVNMDVSSEIVAPTPTPAPTPSLAPSISGIQGYDSSTGAYTNNTISSNKYLILYGSFASGSNTVVIGGTTYTPSYQSGAQINVQLGSLGGSTTSIVVSNSSGNSATMTVNVASNAQVVVPTPTPTPSSPAPSITGLQGYSSSEGYSTSIMSGQYLIVYGSFASTNNSVSVNGVTQSVIYQSASQLNIQLGNISGGASVVVTNANGTSNTMSIPVVSVATAPTPTPTPSPTPTPNPSAPAPSIAGMQGYSSGTGYSTSIISNQYLILYGSFEASGNSVSVNGISQTITYESQSQINVHLGSLSSGTASVVVSNSAGSSNASTIPIGN